VRRSSSVHVPLVVKRCQGHGAHSSDNVCGYLGSCGGVGLRTLTKNVVQVQRKLAFLFFTLSMEVPLLWILVIF